MDDLKDRGAKIIIGDFYEDVARKVRFLYWFNVWQKILPLSKIIRLCVKHTNLEWHRSRAMYGSCLVGTRMTGTMWMASNWRNQKLIIWPEKLSAEIGQCSFPIKLKLWPRFLVFMRIPFGWMMKLLLEIFRTVQQNKWKRLWMVNYFQSQKQL